MTQVSYLQRSNRKVTVNNVVVTFNISIDLVTISTGNCLRAFITPNTNILQQIDQTQTERNKCINNNHGVKYM